MAGNCFSMVSSKDSYIEQTSRDSVKVHFFFLLVFFIHSLKKHLLSAFMYQALFKELDI